jgi:hypothetical protein
VDKSQIKVLKSLEDQIVWVEAKAGKMKCDLCGKDLADCLEFVDGKVRGYESWAKMCPDCFATDGRGLGLGFGQMYRIHHLALSDSVKPVWCKVKG